MSDPASKSDIVFGLAEEFLETCRRGERPSLKACVDRHPDLADQIHELFRVMAIMENIALGDGSLAGEPTGHSQQASPKQ
jgi:hypothetical protein